MRSVVLTRLSRICSCSASRSCTSPSISTLFSDVTSSDPVLPPWYSVKQGEERKAGILAERKHEYDAAHEEGSFEQSQEDAPGAGGAVEKDEVDPSTKANAATAGSKEE